MNEQFIFTLIEKFGSAKIDELDLHEGNLHIVLRKGLLGVPATGAGGNVNTAAGVTVVEAQGVHLGIPAASAAANTAPDSQGVQSGGEKIVSPIVATFYSAPSPDAPAFVKPGAKVKAGQTLCILEAMKMMNHLEAEFDCEIISAHAASGDFVEYGQALFTVKRL